MKDVSIYEPVITIKSAADTKVFDQLEQLADALKE